MPNKSLTVGSNEYVIDTTDESINAAECARLLKQDMLTNEYAFLLPDGFVPKRRMRIADIAAGTCGWIREVHREYPYVELDAVDNNIPIIEHARRHEATKNKRNVRFHVMDILQPLQFEDKTFDFVNMRFGVGVLPKECWSDVLKECNRICKPGGYIRLTEGATVDVAKAPAFHKMNDALMKIAWRLGKSFSETEVAIVPMLPRYIREAGFVNDIRSQCVLIDFSAGSDAHDLVTENFEMVFQNLKGAVLKVGAMSTKEEFDQTFEQIQKEFRDPAFAGVWYISSYQGRKP